jgi:hypothetical protein
MLNFALACYNSVSVRLWLGLEGMRLRGGIHMAYVSKSTS